MSKHTAMVIKAARVLNKRTADECGVDAEDQWKYYSESFISDAEAILEAAGAPELLEALIKLELHDRAANLRSGDDDCLELIRAREVIAKARGEA